MSFDKIDAKRDGLIKVLIERSDRIEIVTAIDGLIKAHIDHALAEFKAEMAETVFPKGEG